MYLATIMDMHGMELLVILRGYIKRGIEDILQAVAKRSLSFG